jgi:hypothetical protein
MNTKRMVIRVMLLVLLAVAASQGQSSHSSQNLPGTFVTTVNFEDTSFKVLHSFTRDGRTTVLVPFGPPCCNDTRVGGLGEWIRTGPREFAVAEFSFDSQDTTVPLQKEPFKANAG